MANGDSDFPYKPNHALPYVFAALFGLTMIAHIMQAAKMRSLFMMTLVIATNMEVIGYAMRVIAIKNDPQLWSYVVSQVGIIVAPSFLSAQDYMIVGRMMSFVGSESTFISHTIITKLFVVIDIVCILAQAAGAGALSGNNASKNSVATGRLILIAGLMLQVVSFSFFVIIVVLFDFKARQLKGDQLKQLRPLFTAYYISAFLIIGRSIYRTIEFATINFNGKAQGYLFNHEWPFYLLDAVPILISIVIFNIVHPASYLPRKKGLRMDGSVEPARKHWWSSAEKEVTMSSDGYLMTRA